MVNPFHTDSVLFDLCYCFHLLTKELYNDPRLVLQIIPIRLITSFGGPTFMDSNTTTSLVREVYDRCPVRSIASDLPIASHSAVLLAEDTVEDISFKLIPEPPHDLIRENSCMHVAYCRSLDDNWVTAAWTDNLGKHQHQASYYMGKGQALGNVFREIWESTLEYINPRKVHWRLFIVSAGPMSLIERKVWRQLAVQINKQPIRFNLTLVSVNTSPLVDFFPKPPETAITTASTHNPLDTSTSIASPNPVSTPLNGPFSPLATPPSTTAAQTPFSFSEALTPFGPTSYPFSTTSPGAYTHTATNNNNNIITTGISPNTRLLDLTDSTAGIILARRLNVAHAVTDHHPALASGYLVKRGDLAVAHALPALEVNIMAVDMSASGQDPTSSAASAGGPQTQQPSRAGAGAARGIGTGTGTSTSISRAPPQRGGLLAAAPPPTSTSSLSSSSSSPSTFALHDANPSSFPSETASTPSRAAMAAASAADRETARQRRYDAVLREVLGMYRRLACLAQARGLDGAGLVGGGLQGAAGGLRTAPWHVVVVMRAAEGLRRCVGVPEGWR